MPARKQAEDKADEKVDDDIKVEPEEATVSAADDAEPEPQSTLAGDVPDPSVELPTPGGPGDDPAPNRVEKAAVLEAVTKPEVTSQNPEPQSLDDLNHRFTHVPPAGFVERKFPVKQ